MKAEIRAEFLRTLTLFCCSDLQLGTWARDHNASCYGRLLGFIDALEMAGEIGYDEFSRMEALVFNVIGYSGRPFPSALNAGPVMPSWEAFKRCQKAGEAIADDSLEPPAPTARPGLRLLCLLVPSRTGEARSLPVHTLHRVPPYASLHGRYHDGAGRGSVALDPLDVPGGTGFYLRETHARAPSAEVLARCVRQRQTDSLRADPRALRVGGLSHAH